MNTIHIGYMAYWTAAMAVTFFIPRFFSKERRNRGVPVIPSMLISAAAGIFLFPRYVIGFSVVTFFTSVLELSRRCTVDEKTGCMADDVAEGVCIVTALSFVLLIVLGKFPVDVEKTIEAIGSIDISF